MKKLVIISIFCLLLTPITGVMAESSIINNNMSNSNVNQYIIINCPDDNCLNWVTDMVSQGQEPSEELPVESEVDEVEDDQLDEEEDPLVEDQADEDSEALTDDPVIEDEDTSEVSTSYVPVEGDIRINEIMSAPETGEKEWIELYNSTDQGIDLEGWILEEGAGQKTTLFGEIGAYGYLVFDKSGLNNSGDVIILKDQNGQVMDSVIYGDWQESQSVAPEKGKSLILVAENYEQTEVVTKGGQNILQQTQPLDEEVVEQKEPVEPTVPEESPEPTTVLPAETQEEVLEEVVEQVEEIVSYQYSEQIRINELLPNPEGSDDAEWIELFNYGIEPLDLRGWSLEDASGTNYLINESLVVSQSGYVVLQRETTALSLNNSNETVYLKDPDGQVIDEFDYEKSKESQSWSFFEDGWQMTEKLTQKAENELPELTIASLVSSSKTVVDYYQKANLTETKTLEKNTKVKVEGQVVVLPGVFSKTYLYLNGSQVYCSKSDFPDLHEGDVVEVTGKISESRGERRVNISSKGDIRIINNQELPESQKIVSTDLTEALEGQFVQLEGELIEKDGYKFFLSDEAGEALVYLKKGAQIDSSLHKVGDRLRVSGIVSQSDEEYRLMPRSNDDIENLNWQLNPVLGQVAESDQIQSTASGFVAVSVLVGFLFVLIGGFIYLFKERVKAFVAGLIKIRKLLR